MENSKISFVKVIGYKLQTRGQASPLIKLLDDTRYYQAAKKLLTHEQLQIMIDDMITLAQRESLIPPRRSRSCSRALRQPTKKWKRLFNLKTRMKMRKFA